MAKSALRVLEIMEFIADQREGCKHAAISKRAGYPKSSLTALLQDLTSKGYLQRAPDNGSYHWITVLWLANSYLRNLNLVKLGQPLSHRSMGRSTSSRSWLFQMDGICDRMHESVPTIFGTRFSWFTGAAVLFCCRPGHAGIHANAQVDEILHWVRQSLTAFTKTAIADIKEGLREVRKTG